MVERKKILYADDEEIFHILVRELFKDSFDIDFVKNGKEALEKALLKKYDIILMDISMPVMSGDESAEKIKSIISDQIIIAMSAFNSSEFNCAPFDYFFQKPVNLDNLKNKLLNLNIDA